MAEDRTVLDHLMDGRNALLLEVTRLNAAIEQLDSVLGRIGSTGTNGHSTASTAVVPDSAAEQPADEPVNPLDEVEVVPPPAVTSRTRSTPRKATARKSTSRARSSRSQSAATGTYGEAPKSIRVHVLEMLAAENRDFGLAEIIDRVHGAGIQAHDDAVRSITIKLMKDGRVERVGRGQYRLARRGAARAASAATATASRVTEVAPEPTVSVPVTSSGGVDTVTDTSAEYGSRHVAVHASEPAGDGSLSGDAYTGAGEYGSAGDGSWSGDQQNRGTGWHGDIDGQRTDEDGTDEHHDQPWDRQGSVEQQDDAGGDHPDSGSDNPSGDAGPDGAGSEGDPGDGSDGYVPPLNLGQPWNS